MPKVSVLMPCFNGAKYILKAIDSVLSQSFRDFELLIYDDQSTDGTYEIVSKLTAVSNTQLTLPPMIRV